MTPQIGQEAVAAAVSFGIGIVIQVLRGFPWFNDDATMATWVVGGVLTTLLTIAPPAGDTPLQFAQFCGVTLLLNIQAIAGGQGVGHTISSVTGGKVLPKFNQFSTTEAKKP